MGRTSILTVVVALCMYAANTPVEGQSPFTNPDNWATYDAPGTGNDGYMGAAYDHVHGYVYFSPYVNPNVA